VSSYGVCHNTVIGEWLTMPAIRSYDSIGACGQYMTYTPNTGECTVYYDKIETLTRISRCFINMMAK